MEQPIFSWTGWDIIDDAANFAFYDCTIRQDFGPLKAGDVFREIDIDFERGVMTVWDQAIWQKLHEIKIQRWLDEG